METAQPPLDGMANPSPANLFSTKDLGYHKHVKSAVAPAYAISSLRSLEPFVDSCTKIFIKQRYQRAGQPVDIGEWMQWYAFDVVGMITFKKMFGFLEQGTDTLGIIEPLFNGVVYASLIGQVPWLHSWLLGNHNVQKFLTKYTPLGRQARYCRYARYFVVPCPERSLCDSADETAS
jgi:hypothetical protein